jgi:hypothetical protein
MLARMRLSPSDPTFDNWPSASGPGVHTDEASSALPEIEAMLGPAATRVLEDVSPSGESERGVRNPGDYSEIIAPYAELVRLGFYTTGIWGPDPKYNVRMVTAKEFGRTRRFLPIIEGEKGTSARGEASEAGVAQPNPYDPRKHLDFFDRMRALEKELIKLEERILGRYTRTRGEREAMARSKAIEKTGRAPKAPPKEPWLQSIRTKMLPAVRFILAQEKSAKSSRRLTIFESVQVKGKTVLLPFGLKWGILAKGNAKLSFVAYSELPMATCPGAGACRVDLEAYDEEPRGSKGWCYSFGAFRQPPAFTRMFLNTLANYCDREATIIAAAGTIGGDEHVLSIYKARVNAAVKGLKHRSWMDYVKNLALNMTAKKRTTGASVFMRLFVDGDINNEDNILAWMDAVRRIGPSGADIASGHGYIDVYGYTKCWQQFVNVDRIIGEYGGWPVNYVVNLSSGSVYASGKYQTVRTAMENLPISRGYFEAIDLKDYVPALREQARLLKENPNMPVPMPKEQSPALEGLDFNEQRMKDFLLLQTVRSANDVVRFFPDVDAAELKKKKLTEPEEFFRYALEKYLDKLTWEPGFGSMVRRELRKDAGETEYLKAYEKRQKARLDHALLSGKRGREEFTDTKLHKKTLALVLHEVLWSFGHTSADAAGPGGSCPLICGNCSDHPDDPKLGVHRCASRTTMQHKVISIGKH